MNLYEILGVSADCSVDKLRQNYHKLLLEYHPDKNLSNDSQIQQRFEDIQNAYKTLSNANLRLKYDQELQRIQLHNLPHTNIQLNEQNDEFICRCGTILDLQQEDLSQIVECPNCSTKIQLDQ